MRPKRQIIQLGKIVLIGLVLGASALVASVLVVSAAGVFGPQIVEEADDMILGNPPRPTAPNRLDFDRIHSPGLELADGIEL